MKWWIWSWGEKASIGTRKKRAPLLLFDESEREGRSERFRESVKWTEKTRSLFVKRLHLYVLYPLQPVGI